ncbi:hypothetical protein D9613_008648 [Agrocybe pediades]|uniref:SET domain-containing protein n=1 Tax=Agrocybe pediades TaxID=84607 RepID=A0A8H4QT70_9AGAR|nr:hypothetical protein D9613_008648 [Agrocybe pediades]
MGINEHETFTAEGSSKQYRLHTISLHGSEPDDEAVISCILAANLIPLLPDPLPCPTKKYEHPAVRVLQTEHKGAGLFALQDIPAGQVLLVEYPALILPAGKFSREVYDELGARLPEKRREELMSMANARSKEECPSYVEGIVRTNALQLELDPKGRLPEEEKEFYGGVYPYINRANHSCGPNAMVKWDPARFVTTFYSIRDISAGEEIVKTYVNPALPRQTRLDILEKNYRFTCDCPWCNVGHSTPQELAQIAASDRDRALLGTWIFTHPGYKKWCRDLARADDVVISSYLEALSLSEKEGMHGLQNLFVEEIAMCYSALGDLDAFQKWAKKTIQLTKVEDPVRAARFEEWLVDPPKKMKQWGWRKTQRELSEKRSKKGVSEIIVVDLSDMLGFPE